jgi:hypothetical protein
MAMIVNQVLRRAFPFREYSQLLECYMQFLSRETPPGFMGLLLFHESADPHALAVVRGDGKGDHVDAVPEPLEDGVFVGEERSGGFGMTADLLKGSYNRQRQY